MHPEEGYLDHAVRSVSRWSVARALRRLSTKSVVSWVSVLFTLCHASDCKVWIVGQDVVGHGRLRRSSLCIAAPARAVVALVSSASTLMRVGAVV